MPNFLKENIQITSNNSSRSIKKLLRQRSLVVAFSLLLTGLGAPKPVNKRENATTRDLCLKSFLMLREELLLVI